MKSQEIQALLSPLKTANIQDKDVGSILQRIRSDAMATKGGFARLVKLGCVPCLLKLMYRYIQSETSETETEKAASENSVNSALSIVANLLMDREARQQVSRHGIETIVNLLEHCTSEDVKMRCCRSLSNLCMGPQIPSVMAEDYTVMALLKVLDIEDIEAEYRSEIPEENPEPKFPSAVLVDAACKTLRYGLGDTDVHQQLVNKGVMRRLGALMKSEDPKLVAPVLKILAELFTKSCSRTMEKLVSEFPQYGVMPKIMALVDSENDKTSVQAFTCVVHLAAHLKTAGLIGNGDGIDFILSHMDSPRRHISKGKLIKILCMLARDAGNRDKLYCANELKVFLDILEDDSLGYVHAQVVKALQCFMYDEDSLTVLLEDRLVTVLLNQLQRFGGFTSDLTVNALRSAESLLQVPAGLPQEGESAVMAEGNVSPHALGSFSNQDASGENCVLERTLSEPIPWSASLSVSQACGVATAGPPQDSALGSEDPCGFQSQERMDTASSAVDRVMSSCVDEDRPTHKPGPAGRQMYSMNSPTYQAETSWRMEDYHPGVTCKSYHSALSPGSHSDSSGASPMSPHSPMSIQSSGSPSHSAQFSPLSSHGLSPYSSPSRGLSPCTSGDCVSLWSSGEESPEHLTSAGVQRQGWSPAHQQDSMFSDTADQEVVFSSAEEDELAEGSKPATGRDRPERSAVDDKLKSVRKVLFEAGEEETTLGQAPIVAEADDALSDNFSQVPDDHTAVSGQTLSQGFKTGQRFFRSSDSVAGPHVAGKELHHNWHESTQAQGKILSLLHQLTYRDDFERYMASYQALLNLTDYLALSRSPINWAVRILSRLISSPHSLSYMLRMCAPAVIVRTLMLDSHQRLVSPFICESNSYDSRMSLHGTRLGAMAAKEDAAKIGSSLVMDLSGASMTPYGKGVILNIFSRLPEVHKLMCAASVLFLHKYWSPKWQQRFLLQEESLERVVSAFCTPRPTDDATVIKDVLGLALINLARDLKIPPRYPAADRTYFLKRAQVLTTRDNGLSPGGNLQPRDGEHTCSYSSVEKNLTITVRDGDSNHTLHAQREMLVEHSTVFDAMLQGNYLEARQSQVVVDDVCVRAMTTVLHYLHCCDSRCPHLSPSNRQDCEGKQTGPCRRECYYKRRATRPGSSPGLHDPQDAAAETNWLQHLLNVIVVADRYLLPDLVQYVCAAVSASLGNGDCVEEVFQFASFHGLPELAEDCVRALLFSPTSVAEVTRRLAALAEGQYSSDFRTALWSLMMRGSS